MSLTLGGLPGRAAEVRCAWCTQAALDALADDARQEAARHIAEAMIWWIDAQTDYDMTPTHLPRIIFVDQSLIDRLSTFDGALATYSQTYAGQPGMVVLSEEFDFADRIDISTLFHELVHVAQSVAGLRFNDLDACSAIPYEIEAVNLQDRWHLEAFGQPRYRDVSEMHSFYTEPCPTY
ncbi:MAG TPA: DUF6647 family protein [Candidatus Paceibacterota bacterium]|nr:DUF6647 family protein [Candidatus Paceibacterota bacterium]